MISKIKNKLLSCKDVKYENFSTSLLPGITNVLGVRLPILRELAKDIVKDDWQKFLGERCDEYFEFRMLEAMVIGYLKCDFEERMRLIKNFIDRINSWSVCDTFCSGLKFAKKHENEVYEFILPYFSSEKEYEVRFAAVMALCYFVNDKFIDKVLSRLFSVQNDAYYSKMAVAWAISVCFVKFPEKTKNYLSTKELDKFTFNKSASKIIESFRVSKEDKDFIRTLRVPKSKGCI